MHPSPPPSGFGLTYSLLPDVTKAFASPYTTAENILSLPMTAGTGDAPGTQKLVGLLFLAYLEGPLPAA